MKFYELISRISTNNDWIFTNLIFKEVLLERNIENIKMSINYWLEE